MSIWKKEGAGLKPNIMRKTWNTPSYVLSPAYFKLSLAIFTLKYPALISRADLYLKPWISSQVDIISGSGAVGSLI